MSSILNLVSFRGRVSRRVFWLFGLGFSLYNVFVTLFGSIWSSDDNFSLIDPRVLTSGQSINEKIFYVIFATPLVVAFTLGNFSILARRLHDRNLSVREGDL